MTQPLDFFFSRGAGARTARIASSNTFLRPFCVNAEHSRYLRKECMMCKSVAQRHRSTATSLEIEPCMQARACVTHRTAPISLATAAACWYAIGFILRSRNRLIVSGSSRKSSLVPTRMMGMLGA